jgi:hypothetical protein
MEIQDGHFQLCQKVADLAWNDSFRPHIVALHTIWRPTNLSPQ